MTNSCLRLNFVQPQDYQRLGIVLEHIVARKKNVQILECCVEMTSTAAAEIRTGFTNAFHNIDTTTLHLLSSDAKDTAAGAGAQAVTLIGIKGSALRQLSIEMAGIAHSHVNDGTWEQLIGMIVTRAGAEGDPAGNIVLDVHATGTVYATIAAGAMATPTMRAYVPTGKNCVFARVSCAAGAAAEQADVLVQGGGVKLRPFHDNNDGILWGVAGTNVMYQAQVEYRGEGKLEFTPDLPELVGDDHRYFSLIQARASAKDATTIAIAYINCSYIYYDT